MVRFGLFPSLPSADGGVAPRKGGAEEGWPLHQRRLLQPQDDEDDYRSYRDADEDTLSSSESESDLSDDGDDEEEEPHPLGFEYTSYGRTRFSLSPLTPREVKAASTRLLAPTDDDEYEYEYDNDDAWIESSARRIPTSSPRMLRRKQQQRYPPIDARHHPDLGRSALAATPALLRHHLRSRLAAAATADDLLEGMDRIASLVRAAGLVEGGGGDALASSPRTVLEPAAVTSARGLWDLAAAAERERAAIARDMAAERTRVEQERLRAAETLRMLIAADEAAAKLVTDREQKDREARDAAERQRIAEEKAEAERRQRLADERIERELKAKADQEKADRIRQEEEAKVAEEERKAAEERRRQREVEEAKKNEHVVKAQMLTAKLVEVRQSLAPFDSCKAVSKRRLQMKKVVRGRLNTLSHGAHKVQDVARDVSAAIDAARQEDEAVKQQIQSGVSGVELTPEMARGKRYLLDLLASNVIVRVQAEGFNGTRGDGFPLAAMLASVSTEAKELGPLLAAHIYTVCPTAIPTLTISTSGDSETDLMESLGMIKDKSGEYESFDRFLHRTEGLISITADIMASTPSSHSLMGGHKGALEWLERFINLLPSAPQSPLPLLTAPVLVAFLTAAGHMLANKFPGEFRPLFDVVTSDIANRLDEGTIGKPSATRLKKAIEGGMNGFRSALPPGAIAELYDGGEGSGSGVVPSQSGVKQGLSVSSNTMQNNPFGGGVASTDITSTTTDNRPPCTFFAQGRCRNGADCKFSHSVPVGGTLQPSTGSTSGFGSNSFAPNSFGQSSSFTNQQQQDIAGLGSASNTLSGQSSFGKAMSKFGQSSTNEQRLPSQGGFAMAGVGGDTSAMSSQSPFGKTVSNPFGQPSTNQQQQTSQGGGPAAGFGGATSTTLTQNPFGKSASNPFGQSSTNQQQGYPMAGFGSATNATSSQSPFSKPQSGSNIMQNNPFGGGGANVGNIASVSTDNRPPCKFFAQGRCRNGTNCKFSHTAPVGGASGGGPSPFGGGGNQAFGTSGGSFGSFGGGAVSNPFAQRR